MLVERDVTRYALSGCACPARARTEGLAMLTQRPVRQARNAGGGTPVIVDSHSPRRNLGEILPANEAEAIARTVRHTAGVPEADDGQQDHQKE